jgi:hypothetical protein
MTEQDLQRVEQAIGRRLSRAVRHFFLNYPEELRTTRRPTGEEDEDGNPYTECPAQWELWDDPDGLISATRPTSQGGLLIPPYPPNMLVIGCGGCGETYWVDLDDERGAVYRFESGRQDDSDRMADSLEDFAQGLIESYRKG